MSSLSRRKLAFGGLVAAAGVAGVGTAWWTSRSRPESENIDENARGDVASDALWRLSFDTPDGKTLAMSSLRGKPLLLNFWATWCPPCVEELPLLNRFYQENKGRGWQVLGLAVDQPSAVNKWLQGKPLSFPVGMAGFGGTELSKSLGNLAGSLPFSAVFSGTGGLLQHKTGKLTSEDLALWVQLK
jgi:thiol-disulfide isomerase/thioredoxin